MDSDRKTCEQRIDAALESRIATYLAAEDVRSNDQWEDLADQTKAELEGRGYGPDEDYDEMSDWAHDSPFDVLSIEKSVVTRIQFSWGGPSDAMLLTWKEDESLVYGWYIDKMEYEFQDWFDGARRTIDDQEIIDMFEEIYAPMMEER